MTTVFAWRNATVFVTPIEATFNEAFDLAARHALQIWDALIVCTAVQAGCVLLLSEDMHDGFVYRGLTIANPFAELPNPRLAALLDSLSPRP